MNIPEDNFRQDYITALTAIEKASNVKPGPFTFSDVSKDEPFQTTSEPFQPATPDYMQFEMSSRKSGKDTTLLRSKAIIAVIISFISMYAIQPDLIMTTTKDGESHLSIVKYTFYSTIMSLILFAIFYYV